MRCRETALVVVWVTGYSLGKATPIRTDCGPQNSLGLEVLRPTATSVAIAAISLSRVRTGVPKERCRGASRRAEYRRRSMMTNRSDRNNKDQRYEYVGGRSGDRNQFEGNKTCNGSRASKECRPSSEQSAHRPNPISAICSERPSVIKRRTRPSVQR